MNDMRGLESTSCQLSCSSNDYGRTDAYILPALYQMPCASYWINSHYSGRKALLVGPNTTTILIW